ncbi:MAG: TonB family protein [Bacteroidales bacterium]|nr:TonB family protein [Bacteroidales bacterium]
MKRLSLIVLLLSCGLLCQAQFRGVPYDELEESEVCQQLRQDAGFFASAALEGRRAGSEGELEAARYYSAQLERCGVDLLYGADGDLFGLRQESGDTLTSRNVVGYIQGYDKNLRDHYIVIGARLDNLGTHTVMVDGEPQERIYYGGNGNASGLAMLLQLARMLSANRVLLKRTVLIAAFGASLQDGAGAWYFLNRSFPDAAKIDAMINLDMVGTPSQGFYAYSGSNASMNQIATALESVLLPIRPTVVSLEPVRSDHRLFYESRIPSMFFTTGMYPEYNSERDRASILEYGGMEKELEYIYSYTLSLTNGEKPLFDPSERLQEPKAGGSSSTVFPYYECDVPPAFLGSTDPRSFLEKWVYVYLKYPQEAIDQGIQGRVLVDFIVDEKGNVTNVQVLRSSDPLLDEAAVKVVEASPAWRPARVKGSKVRSEISVNIEFRLERNK